MMEIQKNICSQNTEKTLAITASIIISFWKCAKFIIFNQLNIPQMRQGTLRLVENIFKNMTETMRK